MTVIVPTNSAGVMARRALGRRGGATAIDVLTLFRAAELLGSPSLLAGGRKPVSTPVVDLAVKQVLTRSPGLYGPVHRHPSTVVALRDLYRELRVAGPTALTALARTARGNEPARVAAEVARLLAPSWYDEGDLLAAAAAATRRQLPDRLARVVVHLPERLRPLERQLLRALGATVDLELIVGMTGHPDADDPIDALVTDLTGGAAGTRCRPLDRGWSTSSRRRMPTTRCAWRYAPSSMALGVAPASTAWPCSGRRDGRTPAWSSTS